MIFKENDGSGIREVYYMKEPVIYDSFESSDNDDDTKDVEDSPVKYGTYPSKTYQHYEPII